MTTKVFVSTVFVATLFLAVVGSVMGALKVEANYASNQDLDMVPDPGTIKDGTLTGTATAPGDGFLYVPYTKNSGVRYGGLNDPADGYITIIEDVSWEQNTIVGVVRPNSEVQHDKMFVSVGYEDSGANVDGLRFQVDVDGPETLRLELFDSNTPEAPAQLSVEGGNLQGGKDFFVATSWSDNLDGSIAMSVYVRTLDGSIAGTEGTADRIFLSGNRFDPGPPANWHNQHMYLGRESKIQPGPQAIFSLDSRVDLFQIYDTYTGTLEDYNALFDSVISGGLPCDFNTDTVCNALDIDLLAEAVRNGTSDSKFNVDGLGDPNIPNSDDYDFYITDDSMIGTGHGDADLNFIVNFVDFVSLSNDFGETGTGWATGNFNTDDNTNFVDFVALSNNFGASFASGSNVPEPAAGALLAMGALPIVRCRKLR